MNMQLNWDGLRNVTRVATVCVRLKMDHGGGPRKNPASQAHEFFEERMDF